MSLPAHAPSSPPATFPAGGDTPRIDRQRWPNAPVHRMCVCGHGEPLHNLSTKGNRRTGCSISDGPKAKPCGCKTFTEKEHQ